MIIVPISGGKDSQCCLELALETNKTVIGLFNDTGWEHPLTYKHINWMETYYKIPIFRTEGKTVETEVIKRNAFPSSMSRFCTRDLKVRPANRFYLNMALLYGHGFEIWCGVRSQESVKRSSRYGKYLNTDLIAPHEFMCEFRRYVSSSNC